MSQRNSLGVKLGVAFGGSVPALKTAVASSGLGHVARGIETWARDTAAALAERGVDVTLFAAGQVSGVRCQVSVLPCLRRGEALAERMARSMPGFTWRWGLKSAYGWEQLSFWWRLWPVLRRGRFDILHVQDPLLADWCRRFRRAGLVRTREILAHGTEETPRFLTRFDYVQHLAPWHQMNAERGMRSAEYSSRKERVWVAIPNFVDVECFSPQAAGNLRAEMGVPENAFVVGCVAAVKRHHKRVDYVIDEFADYLERRDRGLPPAFLLLAGARTPDTDELCRLAEQRAPGRVRICCDLPRARMPAFYRALDCFVLPSLFEMMPIALLEAMASGLPAVVHRHPVLEWCIGAERGGEAAGVAVDMTHYGPLRDCLAELSPEWLGAHRPHARAQAVRTFSKEAVIEQYVRHYGEVAGAGRRGSQIVL